VNLIAIDDSALANGRSNAAGIRTALYIATAVLAQVSPDVMQIRLAEFVKEVLNILSGDISPLTDRLEK
jgi:hypothetical protein